MGDKIDIYKITLEFLKDNKLILYIFAAFSIGGAGGHFIPKIMTAKPVEVTVVTPKQDNKCYECVDLRVQIEALNKQIKDVTTKFNKVNRDFHGGR